jgi:hypothetical protein
MVLTWLDSYYDLSAAALNGPPGPFGSWAILMRPALDCAFWTEEPPMASKQAIDSFLSCRRIAVPGVSRDPRDF